MITLTAEITVKGENATPFVLGSSRLGYANFGEIVDKVELINKRVMLSLECETRDRSDIDKPSFGVISNGGSLSFNDGYSQFLILINSGFLSGGEEIKIFLENTITRQRKKVGVYYAENWGYDNENKTVSVSFKDNLEKLQDARSLKIEMSENDTPMALSSIYGKIYFPSDIAMSPSSQASIIMGKMKSSTLYKDQGNLWSDLKKISDICGFHVYNDYEGNTKIEAEFDLG